MRRWAAAALATAGVALAALAAPPRAPAKKVRPQVQRAAPVRAPVAPPAAPPSPPSTASQKEVPTAASPSGGEGPSTGSGRAATTSPSSPRGPPRRKVYAQAERVASLRAALAALAEQPLEPLSRAYLYASALERGACAGGTWRLRAECLVVASRRACAGKAKAEGPRCALTMDVAVAAVLAERELVPDERRLELLRRFRDFRPAFESEVRRLQGTLAARYYAAMGDAADPGAQARHIDEFCRARTEATVLSWQACAASLAWFLGTAEVR